MNFCRGVIGILMGFAPSGAAGIMYVRWSTSRAGDTSSNHQLNPARLRFREACHLSSVAACDGLGGQLVGLIFYYFVTERTMHRLS